MIPLDYAYRDGILPEDQRWKSDFTYHPGPATESLTILNALNGRMLAKRAQPDGRMINYDAVARVDMVRTHIRPGLGRSRSNLALVT